MMKKRLLHTFTGLLLLSITLVQCKKSTDDVLVLKAPSQSIIFSNVTDLIIDSTGKTVNLKAKVSTPDGLQKIEIIYLPWNISKTIPVSGNDYTISEPLLIPANAALQIHSITIKATDSKGATNFTEIKIGLQDLNFNKVYLADMTNPLSLAGNLYGSPAPMTKIASHTFQIIYYVKTSGLKIRFIPNKTSFTPIAIGTDPNNVLKLITDGTKSLPVTLGAAGYYKITINTLLLNYTVDPYTPTGSAPAQVAFVGRGFYDYPNMNWQNSLPNIILLDKDPVNPFLFTKQLKLGTPTGNNYATAQFIMTTNNGWTDFWRFDNGTSPEYAVFNGGANVEIPITNTPVTYLFVFDAQTNLVQAIKQ